MPEVRLIGAKGDQLGIVPIAEALRIAQEEQTDLVEVAPQADPPVCRLMDHGKFLYEQSKKEREARKSQKQTEIKEIRLRPKTGEALWNVKEEVTNKQGGDSNTPGTMPRIAAPVPATLASGRIAIAFMFGISIC